MWGRVGLDFKLFDNKVYRMNESQVSLWFFKKGKNGDRFYQRRSESLRCPYCMYNFYKSCLHDKLITLSLTAAHSKGSKGAGLRGDGP